MHYEIVSRKNKKFLSALQILYEYKYIAGMSLPRAPPIPFDYNQFWIIAMEGKEPLGYLECTREEGEEKPRLELQEFYVQPRFRKKGIAIKLAFHALALARKQRLDEVHIPNQNPKVHALVKKMQQFPRHFGLGKSPTSERAEYNFVFFRQFFHA
jgi:GNAT superfamily N-acetyltransferase